MGQDGANIPDAAQTQLDNAVNNPNQPSSVAMFSPAQLNSGTLTPFNATAAAANGAPGFAPPGAPGFAAPKAAGPGGFGPVAPGDVSLDSVSLGPDGHLYGERRIISGDPNAPGQSKYDFQAVDLGDSSNIALIAQNFGFGVGALDQKFRDLRAQNAQVKAQGYGKLLSVNPDGSFSYQDATGTRQTTSDPAVLASVGITPGEIAQQKAQAGESQRTLTQMGQFTVAGMGPDGSLQVRDFNGALSTVTAADAAGGKIPGVSYADFQRAQSDFLQNQKTATMAGQYEAVTANPDGTIAVKDFYGNVTNVPADKALTLPGVSAGQVQYLQQQGNDRNFQGAQATNYSYLATGAPNAPITGAPPPGGLLGGTPAMPTPGAARPGAPAPGLPPPVPGGYQQPRTALPQFSSLGMAATPAPSPQSNAAAPSTPPAVSGGFAQPRALSPSSPGTPPATGGGFAQPRALPSAGQQAAFSATQPGMAQLPKAFTAAGFTGTNQGLGQANQGMQNYYQYGQNQFDIAHQAQDQANTAYRYNQTQVQDQNAGMSRNASGLGFSGIQRPNVAGYGG